MTTRRDFLRRGAGATAACLVAAHVVHGADAPASPAADSTAFLTRKIPSTGEILPAVGFGTYAANIGSGFLVFLGCLEVLHHQGHII